MTVLKLIKNNIGCLFNSYKAQSRGLSSYRTENFSSSLTFDLYASKLTMNLNFSCNTCLCEDHVLTIQNDVSQYAYFLEKYI